MAKKKIIKAAALAKPDMTPVDNVRNPNFDAALAMQNYRNSMEDQQARLAVQGGDFTQGRLMGAPTQQPIPPGANLMPIGGTGISAEQMQNLTPDRRQALESAMAIQQGENMPAMPIANQPPRPNPAMNPMANYNQMLQQGMQRNADMNQAVQNLVGMGGPAKSFSQMAGGPRRTNRAPRQPRNNSLAPSNQRLI